METITDDLAEPLVRVRRAVREMLADDAIRAYPDHHVIEAALLAGELVRLGEAIAMEVAAEVEARSATPHRDERSTVRHGCHNVSEFLQRATGVSPQTIGKWTRAARMIRGDVVLTTGEVLPPLLPRLREVVAAGVVGVDGLLAAGGPLADVRDRCAADALGVADAALAEAANGDGSVRGDADSCDGSGSRALPPCAELLRVHALAWAAHLDPDGAAPDEARAVARRGLTLGVMREGVVPVRGNLLPDVAAQLVRLHDALANPRVNESPTSVRFVPSADAVDDDHRTPAQRRHDAFATALMVAAASGQLPTLGGAPATLVVHVTEDALSDGRGVGDADGTPVSLAAARHAGCAGAVQRIVSDASGRVLRIHTEERVFNRHQRRAIAHRDGGCVIPGCGVPPAWCEVHHVIEHAQGGPTSTDNGVLLCWHHHRYLETSGWQVRMRAGTPETKAPPWIDPRAAWRPAVNPHRITA